ncbi:tRNA (adenosine(37)-N6)-threonylcarbamoyltransferase complex transferase subunit TsaD [archaeon]|jgi:N6-L-threonylcarbamoyladenine synthase|nr:tRNA (adenosine(37)-N6)-threonylcarbamoyltransferase complex transferase subunit TsaD [archaeon]MBT3730566.1 tRNA (adenosine(37)-N6)-threonylcarbamoyltransferase complex transferase subunit TsaD [archaeon]MBT4669468.1 tRNA (adenosine(37)-N6)-threonylcarbamoyltransferase complex transferase subunit TsaD [archaeon]MBT5030225.1 tRNA (adenosine(37)-N6)-threonylcarbamoyltransferase complex transferase subunit TsaD [archaeon]MBT5287676.1 tRNA (adenosine(37)-N6)-threonylcarbamoyltransferase complex
MKVLGIESTAHTFGIGITNNNKILTNIRDTLTTEKGGMIPNELADHHNEVKHNILKKALQESKLSMKDIDLISYSEGPGMAPALLVGRDFALELSKKHNIKLIGVNHILAHLEIGLNTTKAIDPIFLFCSGANTQVIAHEGDRYRVFGEALSIAIGNALDKFARKIGLGFPGGPKVEQLAKKGKLIDLPYKVKGMDVDFSGIITKAINLYQKGESVEDLCFSLQETCFAMLIEVTERALAHCEKNEVLLIGGVAANKRFSEMLHEMCKARGAKAYTVSLEYAGDQGAMIAYQGYIENKRKQKEFDINPRWRIDEIETFWKTKT